MSWCTWALVYEDDNVNATYYSIVELKIYIGNQDSVVSVITRLQAKLSKVRIPTGPRELCLLQNVHTWYGARLASYSLVTRS